MFPLRALTTLAERLPIGGDREVAMALLMGARLALGCTTRSPLDGAARRARVTGVRHWFGALSLPAAMRTAGLQVAEATLGDTPDAVASALERMVAQGGSVLDSASRGELKQLVAALRAT